MAKHQNLLKFFQRSPTTVGVHDTVVVRESIRMNHTSLKNQLLPQADQASPPFSEVDPPRFSVFEKLPAAEESKLGTYIGVFRPTLLTILGAIMFLRFGYVVGHAGLFGALLILLMTYVITGTATLSFSSITTNIRLKTGGVFALVSQSLGLEAGGALGLPLYFAQVMGSVLCIYGFAEGWAFLYPEHNTKMVILTVYAGGLLLAFISEKMVLQLQFLVLLALIIAFISMFGSLSEMKKFQNPEVWGSFKGVDLWVLFAVFFPAGTGIKVGASLAGKLEDPRRSIPIGTMAAWAVSFVVYALLIIWYAVVASPKELQTNYLIALDRALWGPAVLIGLLATCASGAISLILTASADLAALGRHGIVPKGRFLAKSSRGGNTRNATLVTGGVIACGLLLGDLNRVASLITMFYLITYATLNIVVLIEQSLGLLSFRPTFKVPIWVPALGTITSVFAMIITNPAFGLVALSAVVGVYIYLERKQLATPWETVRSGIFIALADWAARQTQKISSANERAWKPDLLVPIDDPQQLQGEYRLLLSIMNPKGSLHVLNVHPVAAHQADERLDEIVRFFQREEIFATYATIESPNILAGVRTGMAVLKGTFFKPNILFINAQNRTEENIRDLITMAKSYKMGVALFFLNEQTLMGRERDVNIWVRDQSPDWRLGLRMANLDLSILLGYQLNRNWQGRLAMITCLKDPEESDKALNFLQSLQRDARLPVQTKILVKECEFADALPNVPKADLNIFGLDERFDLQKLHQYKQLTAASCLFVMDSGEESALA